MATDNDKLNRWQTVKIDIPDFLEDVREGVNTVANFILTVLEIALAALNVVKVFVATFLNPIGALLSLLIDEINAFINDIRNIGLYLNGDWYLLDYPFEDLRGGYQAYETRMLARLTDRLDPSRPDVSSRTTVFGAFFYTSAGIGEVARLVAYVKALASFFRLRLPASGLATPEILQIRTGPEALSLRNLSLDLESTTFQAQPVAKLIFGVKPRRGKVSTVTIPLPPPAGFLVSISTLPDGLPLVFDRPSDTAPKLGVVQPREMGLILNDQGQPVVLFGGLQQVLLPRSLQYNANTDLVPIDGATRVYALLDPTNNAPVPLELLGNSSVTYLQKFFFVSNSVFNPLNWIDNTFTLTLNLEDMPRSATFEVGADGKVIRTDEGTPGVYYARVAMVSDRVAEEERFFFDFTSAASTDAFTSGKAFQVPLGSGFNVGSDISPWSEPVAFSFYQANTEAFLRSLETALLVMVLAKVDLPILAASNVPDVLKEGAQDHTYLIENMALVSTGLEVFSPVLTEISQDLNLHLVGGSPLAWRQALLVSIKRAAKNIYRRIGTRDDLEARLAAFSEDLRTLTLAEMFDENPNANIRDLAIALRRSGGADLTLLQALASTSTSYGLAPSVYGMGASPDLVERFWKGDVLVLGRKPHLIEVDLHAKKDPYNETLSRVVSLTPDLQILGFNMGAVLGGIYIPPEAPDVFSGSPDQVKAVLDAAPPDLRPWISSFVQPDGSIQLPDSTFRELSAFLSASYVRGSSDDSPVFYVDQANILNLRPPGAVCFLRSVFGQVQGNRIYAQAQAVLAYALAPLLRPAGDGEWIALRLFDALPGIEDFLEAINNFLRILNDAIKGFAEAILRYIAFLESRILELQRLVRRINALLQSLLTFDFPIQGSALLLVSSGTDGLMGDFLAAQDKPFDSPLDYGAGVVLVAPFAPAFIVDLFSQASPSDTQGVGLPGSAFGPGDLVLDQPPGPEVEEEPPEVL